jgi:hypothetical protein
MGDKQDENGGSRIGKEGKTAGPRTAVKYANTREEARGPKDGAAPRRSTLHSTPAV